MKWLEWIFGALLLVAVFVRHNAINAISEWSGMSRIGVFYVLGGMWESILCGALLIVATAMKPSVGVFFLKSAMWVGLIEGSLTAGCRLAIHDIGKLPAGVNTCDYLAGFEIGKPLMIFYFLLICWLAGRERHAVRSS